jgi:homocysteine S-methyltransferase
VIQSAIGPPVKVVSNHDSQGARLPHIIDGGLSTELQRIGATFDGPLWTGRALLEHPELIEQAHRNFIDAGAEVVITSSYQVSRAGFIEVGLTAADADRALTSSVETVKRAAAGTGAKVAASIGPYGAILHDGSEYRGNYGVSQDTLTAFHAERIAVLAAAGPDILLAETIPDLTEAKALAAALKDSTLPVWVSFTAGTTDRLWSGDLITDAIAAVSQISTLEAIGFNCVDPDLIEGLVATAKSATNLPIAVYPNKGGRWDAVKSEWTLIGGASADEYWPAWQNLGITYVGGCCGLDAPDIAKLSAAAQNA